MINLKLTAARARGLSLSLSLSPSLSLSLSLSVSLFGVHAGSVVGVRVRVHEESGFILLSFFFLTLGHLKERI